MREVKLVRRIAQVLLAAALVSLPCARRIAHADDKIEIEVASFQGGYGIDFFEQCAREYEKMHPNVKIKLWGNPRSWEQLLPRFAAGTPPDLTWPGWGMSLWELIFGNQMRPLDEYLAQPAYGVDRKWADTFVPSLLSKYRYQGHVYFFPYNFEMFAWWYNKKLFDANGWRPPKTYDELLTLCEKMRAKHIAPVTFTGRYPDYMYSGFYLPWVISAGGLDVYNRAQNLEPGAWQHPAFVRAAECIMEMKHLGNFQSGAIGMNHTESQMEFLVGRAAMIPCGTWLHSEMKNLLPPDFEMVFMLCPVFADGKGDPTCVYAGLGGNAWGIPVKGKHPEVAADFFRYMSSPEKARQFVEQKGCPMAVRDLGDVNPPAHLKEPLRFLEEAKSTWSRDMNDWYPKISTEMNDVLRDLYNEVIPAAEFCRQLEAIATKYRNDPNIRKFRVE